MNAIIQGKDALQQMGDSAELFTFATVSTTYYYTSYSEDITYGGNLYQAVPIKRSGFTADVVEGLVRCMVQAPVSGLFTQYIIGAPFIPISVEIRRIYLDDLVHSELRFIGSVNSIAIEKQVASVECLSSMDELKRKVPRVVIQSTCNHALYSAGCTILKNNYATNFNFIPDAAGTRLYLAVGNFTVSQLNFYINGIAEYIGDTRFICNQGLNYIDLYFPFFGLSGTVTIKTYAGCDKKVETCRTKFNNEVNFLGMPFVKKTPNPVTQGM